MKYMKQLNHYEFKKILAIALYKCCEDYLNSSI